MQRKGVGAVPFWMVLFFCAGGLLVACGSGGGATNASIPSAPGAPGAAATPSSTPSPTPSTSSSPVPTQSNLLYVSLGSNQAFGTEPSEIAAFPLNSGGNIAPVKTISQYQNDLPAPTAITFDNAGNLYVANINYPGLQGSTDFISVFAPRSSGTAIPIRTIGAGQGSTLGNGMVEGLGVDASGYVYVAVSEATQPGNINDNIFVFAPNATGNVPPVRTIASSACFRIGGLATMPSGSLIVSCVTSGTPEIETFAPGASGNATPSTVISGSNTQLTNPGSVAVSPLGSIVVLQRVQPGSILTFPQTANGNVAPTTDITGSSTQLTGYGGVTVDANGNIYAINAQCCFTNTNVSIAEYAANATGNAAPLNTISGSNTNLAIGDGGIAIGPP